MDPEQRRLELLELLVEELIKDQPQEERIRQYMEKSGLKYCQNPIERMDRVLRALHFQEPEKEIVE